jgi:uncharacterized protein (DUF58 family)
MNARKIVIFSVPLALLALALLGGSILLLRVFFLSVLIIGISYLWARFSLYKLNASLAEPPDHLQVGDSFQRLATISNPSLLPRFWLEIRDNADISGHPESTIASIRGHSNYSWQTPFHCIKRGRYHIGPVTIEATDPFGLFSTHCTLGEAHDVTIYPTTVDLPLLRFVPSGEIGHGSGYQSVSHISPNASSVRESTSGDGLHYIHWPSTARAGKLMVKTFDADHSHNASKTTWVLLDMNEESHFGRGQDATDEYAVTLAASVAKRYLRNGMKVGIIAASQEPTFVIPERGESQLWRILESLALVKTDWKAKLGDIVGQHLDSMRDNPLVVIIGTSATEGLMDTVRQLRNRAGSIVVILLDVSSFGGRPISMDITRTLTWSGAQVFTIRKDDDLARVLNSSGTERYASLV